MRRQLTVLVALMATLALAVPAGAGAQFPPVVPLPDGIGPEGIASGTGTEFFTGALDSGAIYKGDFRTGEGGFINDPADFDSSRAALGMKHDQRTDALWVAGGPTGQGFVYDSDTGDTLAILPLAAGQPTFVNDVVVTRNAAYFTDSFQPVIYRVTLTSKGLPTGDVETITLGGDFAFFPGQFNGNGIDATPDGQTLVLVNSFGGALYTVDPRRESPPGSIWEATPCPTATESSSMARRSTWCRTSSTRSAWSSCPPT